MQNGRLRLQGTSGSCMALLQFHMQITVFCSPSIPVDSHGGGSLHNPVAPLMENSPGLPTVSSLNLRGFRP